MNKCLLIVDVQRGFINDSTQHIPRKVEQIQKKYENVFVTRFYNEKDSFFRKLIEWNRFDIDSEDFELAFTPCSKAIIINKSTYTCVNSGFIQKLNNLKINTIDIVGIDTDICVTKCAIDLFEIGIIPRVLSDYCASHAGQVAHDFALKTLARYIGSKQVI